MENCPCRFLEACEDVSRARSILFEETRKEAITPINNVRICLLWRLKNLQTIVDSMRPQFTEQVLRLHLAAHESRAKLTRRGKKVKVVASSVVLGHGDNGAI